MNPICASLLVEWIGTETPRTLRIARSAIVQAGWFDARIATRSPSPIPASTSADASALTASFSSLHETSRHSPATRCLNAGASPLPAMTSSRTWATCRASTSGGGGAGEGEPEGEGQGAVRGAFTKASYARVQGRNGPRSAPLDLPPEELQVDARHEADALADAVDVVEPRDRDERHVVHDDAHRLLEQLPPAGHHESRRPPPR